MRRWMIFLGITLFGLLALWRSFGTEPERSPTSGLGDSVGDAGQTPAPAGAADGQRPDGAAQAASPAVPLDARAQDQRPAKPVPTTFAALVRGKPEERPAIEAALRRQIEAASGRADQILRLAGENNSFLHSEAGRLLVDESLRTAGQLSAQQALSFVGQLLERCMRGRISHEDAGARAAVDRLRDLYLPLVRRVVFDPSNLAGSQSYRVVSGDSLDGIARRFAKQGLHLEAGTLALVNRISNPRQLGVGKVLKVPGQPIRAVVEKRSFLMGVYLGDALIRLYWVGHGKDDRTPVTKFTVGAKQKHPDWYSPEGRYPYGHEKNVLGDYFVKFDHESLSGFGAHGTPDPASIGKAESLGCIRMGDADIKEFFEIVPRHAVVEIRDSTW